MSARVAHVSREQIAEHPHALLLVVAQHVLLGLQRRRVPVATVIDTGYRANPEHFATQMEVFESMRETGAGGARGRAVMSNTIELTLLDFSVANHGSVVILYAHSAAAREWVDENLPHDAMTWGSSGTVIESRYIDAIVEEIRDAGMCFR